MAATIRSTSHHLCIFILLLLPLLLAHQRTAITISNGVYQYRPTAASGVGYGNNVLNQYTTVGGVVQSYDGNGNLTGDGTGTYGYDSENRLIAATVGGISSTYAYDALGRRREKIVNGVGTGYQSDGEQEVAEYDATLALQRRYIYGAGLDEPVAQVAGGALSYLHADGTGSVIARTSTAGVVLDRYGYGAYGESATAAGVAYRYAGRRLDGETGLYYNRARMYSTKLGRFLQPDPSGTADGANLYAYTNNDPVNKTDPSGRFAQGVESGAYETFFGSYDTSFFELMRDGNTANRVGGAVGFAAGFAGNLGIEVVSALALDGVLRGVGGVVKGEAGISANAARGRASEARVLNDLGLTKNTTAVSTAEGRSIPDALTATQSIEIKDAARVNFTRQLQIQTDNARNTGIESVLITGDKTCVSGRCADAFDLIVRRPDLGPK